MKTIKQIADEINISKQKVYRFVKKECISEVHQELDKKSKVMYYDEIAEMLIKNYFIGESASKVHQNHINEVHQDDEVHQKCIKSASKVHQNHINEVHQDGEAHQKHIKSTSKVHQNHIKSASSEELYNILKEELKSKNELIERLQNELDKERQYSREQGEKLAIITDQAQKLQLAQMTPQILENEKTENEEPVKKSFWSRIFGI